MSFLYFVFGGQKQLRTTYGVAVMEMAVENFSRWAVKILNILVEEGGVEQTSQIVSALFF